MQRIGQDIVNTVMNLGVVKDVECNDHLFDYGERSVLGGVSCQLSLSYA